MNATSKLVYPGPTTTHKFPSIASRENERYGTLLGWAETKNIAEQAAYDFLNTPPVPTDELLGL